MAASIMDYSLMLLAYSLKCLKVNCLITDS